MRILIIVPSYKPAYFYGGPIRSIASLCEALVSHGHRVTVLTTNANGSRDLDVSLGVPYQVEGVHVIYFNRITKDHSNFSPTLLGYLWRYLKSFDAVHIQSWWNMVALPAALICKFRGVHPVITPRGSLTSFTLSHGHVLGKKALHFLVGRRLLKASLIHVTSKRECSEATNLIKGIPCVVIPNILNIENPVKAVDKDPKVFKVLFLGRIDPAKNLELLLGVFSSSFSFPVQLLIAGDGHEKYLESLKKRTRETEAIHWLGHQDGLEKDLLLASSDVLVLPSHTENFGNVVIEALAQGTPVLLSEGVGLKDFVVEHRVGRIVKNDTLSWREAIEEMYRNKDFRLDVNRRGREVILSNMGKSTLILKYEEMYEKVRIL